jgi:transcriptional regulator with XRE-family HTH domain
MLGERIGIILKERGISLAEFAEMCDLPFETVKNVRYGKTTDPKVSTMDKMATALNMSINCLLGKCPHTPEERAIIENYRKCGKHGRSIISTIARYEASAMRDLREASGKHLIPCVVPHGEIKKGIVYELCETFDIEIMDDNADIAIEMNTNDLAPIYCKGDRLLFEERFPQNGEVGAFFCGDRIFIRRYCEEGNQYRWGRLHKQAEDIIVKRMDEVNYLGTCIGVVRT